jgi:hypothetical protein
MARNPNWLSSFLGTLGFVASAAMVQAWAARLGWQWDATTNHRWTLSPYTKRVLAQAAQAVRLNVFVPSGVEQGRLVLDLVDRLRRSEPQLRVEVFDTNRNPEWARRLGVNSNVAIVVEGTARRRVVTQPSELSVAAAIAAVARRDQPRVCWVGRSANSDRSYEHVPEVLRAEGFEVVDVGESGKCPLSSAGAPTVTVLSGGREIGEAESRQWRRAFSEGGAFWCSSSPTPEYTALSWSGGSAKIGESNLPVRRYWTRLRAWLAEIRFRFQPRGLPPIIRFPRRSANHRCSWVRPWSTRGGRTVPVGFC